MQHKTIYHLLAYGLLCMLSACKQTIDTEQLPRPALVIKVGETTQGHQGMVLVGEVKSRYESNISFRVNGKINARKVEVGDQVRKGQVLAVIDANDANLSVQAAISDVNAAEASYALAQAELERQRHLQAKNFISKSALEMREAEFKTADARLRQVKSQAAISSNQSRYTQLVADRDGIVAQINAEPGQVVEAGQTVAQIVDYSHLEVLVAVPESRMGEMQIDRQVQVKLWADNKKTYRAVIREISPTANPATHAFDVRVALQNADAHVRIGMTASVHFESSSSDKLIIPSTALTQIQGKNTVWVIGQDGVAQPRIVQTGQFSELGVEVIHGLILGEQVAVAGVHTLVKGQKVKPTIVQTKPESSL